MQLFGNFRNKFGRSSAAPTEDLYTHFGDFLNGIGKLLGRNVVQICDGVGKTCVRANANRHFCPFHNFFDNRERFLRTERAVHSHSVCARALKRENCRSRRAARKCAEVFLEGHRADNGQRRVLLCGKKRGFSLGEVGHGFDCDEIRACFFACFHDFAKHLVSLVNGHITRGTQHSSQRTHVQRHENVRSLTSLFCDFDSLPDNLVNGKSAVFELVSVSAEGVRVDSLRACRDILTVDILD